VLTRYEEHVLDPHRQQLLTTPLGANLMLQPRRLPENAVGDDAGALVVRQVTLDVAQSRHELRDDRRRVRLRRRRDPGHVLRADVETGQLHGRSCSARHVSVCHTEPALQR